MVGDKGSSASASASASESASRSRSKSKSATATATATAPNGTDKQVEVGPLVDSSNHPSTNPSCEKNVNYLHGINISTSMIALTTVEVKQGDKTVILTGNINQTNPQNSILHGVQRSGVGSPVRDQTKRIDSSKMITVLVPKFGKGGDTNLTAEVSAKKNQYGFFFFLLKKNQYGFFFIHTSSLTHKTSF